MSDATAPSSHLDVLLDAREIRWAADGHLILGGVDLEVAAGTIVGLVGPNGSGKTTLLRAVTRLIEADGGSVTLGGTDTTTLRRRDLARQIALVEQHAATGLDLSVLDVVLLGRTPHRSLLQADSSDDVDLARSALADVDMAGTERRRWHTLSGGEQQRVQLARAIVQQPRLLVLDEPTNHLDIGHQLQLLQFVRQAGVTTLAALHDLNLAAMFCDAVVVLDAGRVAAAGPATEVITPSLLADVFGVRADVTQHPATGRPLIVLHPPAPDRR